MKCPPGCGALSGLELCMSPDGWVLRHVAGLPCSLSGVSPKLWSTFRLTSVSRPLTVGSLGMSLGPLVASGECPQSSGALSGRVSPNGMAPCRLLGMSPVLWSTFRLRHAHLLMTLLLAGSWECPQGYGALSGLYAFLQIPNSWVLGHVAGPSCRPLGMSPRLWNTFNLTSPDP